MASEMQMRSSEYTQVYPNLYVGSAPFALPLDFDVIVFAAAEYQPEEAFDVDNKQLIVFAPLDDAKPTETEKAYALRAACVVADSVRTGRKVLVTCYAGHNRSGLIAGLAMRMLGVKFQTIVTRLRDARGPDALSNRWFLQMVEAA